MSYSETLADRIRTALGPDVRVTEIRMFGGICFMVRGHMTCGVIGDAMLVRVGRDSYDRAVALANAGPMMFTGRAMKGIVRVGPEGCTTARGVKAWIRRALAFNETMPAKSGSPRNRRPARKVKQD